MGYQQSISTDKVIKDKANNLANEIYDLRLAMITTFSDKLNLSIELLITSNEKIADASSENAKKMTWFTGALVFVGCVQIFAVIMK